MAQSVQDETNDQAENDQLQEAIGTWEVDDTHSTVEFTVRHMMSRVRGTFTDFSATISIPSLDFTEAGLDATVQVASLTTHQAERDAHVKSTDFFADPESTMNFRSRKVIVAPRAKYQSDESPTQYAIIGDLTVNGFTKEVELTTQFLGLNRDAFGELRLGFEASTQIDRNDFGVKFNVPLGGDRAVIGDRVDIDLAIQAVKKS